MSAENFFELPCSPLVAHFPKLLTLSTPSPPYRTPPPLLPNSRRMDTGREDIFFHNMEGEFEGCTEMFGSLTSCNFGLL